MNAQNAHEYLPLVQALADGKTIQFQDMTEGWNDRDDLTFADDPKYYRVKPEPRTFEMWLSPVGMMFPYVNSDHPTYERITVQEVLQ